MKSVCTFFRAEKFVTLFSPVTDAMLCRPVSVWRIPHFFASISVFFIYFFILLLVLLLLL